MVRPKVKRQAKEKQLSEYFKEHCGKCGSEVEVDTDRRFGYVTKWCRGCYKD